MKRTKTHGIRKNLKDIWWNSFMVKGCAVWDIHDIPVCRTNRVEKPDSIITWKEAVTIYNKMIARNRRFRHPAYICFYIDDERFDGINGIWFNPYKALRIIRLFAGIITPDFSTNRDFPEYLKGWNTYRMRAFGFWCSTKGINVINNVRWDAESLDFCFLGIPKDSIVAIGTVASRLKFLKNRSEFEQKLLLMIETLRPKIIIVYGSASYPCFDSLWTQGIEIVQYPSSRNRKSSSSKGGAA